MVEPWMDFIGLGQLHRDEHKVTTFSAQNHVTYLREVGEGTNLTVSTQLLGFDRKRIHAMQVMWNADERFVSATCEVMSLHVSPVSPACSLSGLVRKVFLFTPLALMNWITFGSSVTRAKTS